MPITAPAHAPERSAPLAAAIDAALDGAHAEQRLVGSVVLVAHQGRLVYRRASGWADREAARPMREDALFRLASVSKPIVTTAAMIRVAEGRLALDAPVRQWLPQFCPALADGRRPDISLRQLLSHTAGLGYRFLDADSDGPHARAGVSDGMDAAGLDLAENLRRIAQVPLRFAPGEDWGYSLAIDVVGAVLEALERRPLQEIVRACVTAPLGMHDTAFHALDPARLATPYVGDSPVPHRLAEGETVAPFAEAAGIVYSPARALDPSSWPSAGAGMVGSAIDVLRLLEALRNAAVPGLPAPWVTEMGRVQSGDKGPPDAPGYGFGLGFSVLRDPAQAGSPESAGTWRWGGAYGHSWFVDPARQLSVVALTNTLYEGMSGRFVGELRDAVYAGLDGVHA
jgi:CubicO group peptidase (beta-lactamase class C family)